MVFKTIKYANNTYRIVSSRTIPHELQYISDWAKHHNLKLNQTKSLEIIISLPTNTSRLDSNISHKSWFPKRSWHKHSTPYSVLTSALQILLIKLQELSMVWDYASLWSYGRISIHDVAQATLIARLKHAAPAWWGLFTLAERDRIQSDIKKPNVTVIYHSTFLMSLALSMLLKLIYNSVQFCLIHTMFSSNKYHQQPVGTFLQPYPPSNS